MASMVSPHTSKPLKTFCRKICPSLGSIESPRLHLCLVGPEAGLKFLSISPVLLSSHPTEKHWATCSPSAPPPCAPHLPADMLAPGFLLGAAIAGRGVVWQGKPPEFSLCPPCPSRSLHTRAGLLSKCLLPPIAQGSLPSAWLGSLPCPGISAPPHQRWLRGCFSIPELTNPFAKASQAFG